MDFKVVHHSCQAIVSIIDREAREIMHLGTVCLSVRPSARASVHLFVCVLTAEPFVCYQGAYTGNSADEVGRLLMFNRGSRSSFIFYPIYTKMGL